VSLGRC